MRALNRSPGCQESYSKALALQGPVRCTSERSGWSRQGRPPDAPMPREEEGGGLSSLAAFLEARCRAPSQNIHICLIERRPSEEVRRGCRWEWDNHGHQIRREGGGRELWKEVYRNFATLLFSFPLEDTPKVRKGKEVEVYRVPMCGRERSRARTM